VFSEFFEDIENDVELVFDNLLKGNLTDKAAIWLVDSITVDITKEAEAIVAVIALQLFWIPDKEFSYECISDYLEDDLIRIVKEVI
jgi:hypothetical protein